jgi:ABC-type glycerol-3-phosphate transport system substrate-binding protein
MLKRSLTRRSVLKAAAFTPPAIAASSLAAPFVHGAYAAGTLSIGTWDHWVPGASQVLEKICQEWAAKEKVELKFDLITSNGDKDLLTLMAEGQAKAGHDIMGLRTWYVASQAERFVPVDDIVNPLLQKYGKTAMAAEYCAKIDGQWLAVPTCYGSSSLPPCARIDYLKEYAGLDVQKMYPGPDAQADKELVDNWTWETFLTVAEKCAKGGHPFGLGLSTCTDAINVAGSVFAAYGAEMVDAKGTITVNSDATRQVLDWYKRLAKTMPDSVYAYDNASNNKELVSGKAALIMNPPSAYAVAARDKPEIARQLWTFSSPKGPKGRFDPAGYYYWGIWNFSKSIPAAKSLLAHLTQREIQEKLVNASSGFDIPPFESFMDFKAWETVEPPKYTVYNFPPRRDVIPHLTGFPAPLRIGTQMWAQGTMCKMIAQHTQSGMSAKDSISWAESELESYMRK